MQVMEFGGPIYDIDTQDGWAVDMDTGKRYRVLNITTDGTGGAVVTLLDNREIHGRVVFDMSLEIEEQLWQS